MEKVLDEQTYCARVLYDAYEKIKDEPAYFEDALAVTELRITQIKEAMAEFKRLHFEIRAYDKGNEKSSTAHLQAYEGRYIAVMAKLNERLTSLQPIPDNTMLNATLGGGIIRVETKRPPEIPKFDGTASKWPAFRDLFKAEVDDREFDNVTKLRYLQQACEKRAAQTLGIWKPTAENYNAAWALLQTKYSDSHRITQSLLDDIFGIQKQTAESHDGLRTIIDVITSTLRQLDVLGIATESWDEIIIHIVTARLPSRTLESWEQKRIGLGKSPTLKQLFEFLEAKASGRRFVDEPEPVQFRAVTRPGPSRPMPKPQFGQNNPYRIQRYQPYVKPQIAQRPFTSTKQAQQPASLAQSKGQWKCYQCGGPHLVGKCHEFEDMSMDERRMKVQSWKACLNCFGLTHKALECRQRGCGLCPDSVQKHHLLLCKVHNKPQ